MSVNPNAVLLIAFATVAGALLGHVLLGLFIGLAVVLVVSIV